MCTKLSKYTIYRVVIFVETFVIYAFFHAARKTLSNSKDSISIFWTHEPFNASWPAPHEMSQWRRQSMLDNYDEAGVFLGVLDTIFMVCYAIGLYLSGWLGERIELRKLVTAGTVSTAITLMLFGYVLPMMNCKSMTVWAVVWGLNGFAQSTGWPSLVTIMSNWFGVESRGLVLGCWSACASVGNIMGALMVNQFLPYGFQYSFMCVSFTLLILSAIVFLTLVETPTMVGLPPVDVILEDEQPIFLRESPMLTPCYHHTELTNIDQQVSVSFISAGRIPGVIEYASSFLALKLVNYSFFFWLPYYLHNSFEWSEMESNSISTWFDVGSIIGGVVGGVGSDFWGLRSPVVFTMAVSAVPALFALRTSTNDKTVVSCLITIVGIFIGGASNMIGAACSADLGRAAIDMGMGSAVPTVTGIIDGTGSIGAAIGQIAIPLMEEQMGWNSVFYMFMVMSGISGLALLPITYREMRSHYYHR